jgi:hypothetical protein
MQENVAMLGIMMPALVDVELNLDNKVKFSWTVRL